MDTVLNVTFASSLTNLCEVNSSFDTGTLRICYPGENQNRSFISKETINKCLPTIYNCPIVCNYDRDTDTLGGHDMEVVRYDDGSMRLVNLTNPVGVIPESANVWFEDYTEDDGTVREYLYADALIWKRQEAYNKIKKDGITAHSMEIKVKDSEKIDGVTHINDFEFNAFALIGVTPCFESSALEMFSKDNFKQQMSGMMQDLKDTYESVNYSKENCNKHPQDNPMKGGNKVLDEKTKLAADYGIDVSTLDFSLDDFTVEELTEKFESMKTADDAGTEPTVDEPEKFALTSNIVNEIQRVLSAEKYTDRWGDSRNRYYYVDCDAETMQVYCEECPGWTLYGFSFSMDGDSVKIDFDSKKRKKYEIVDFEEGQAEQVMPFSAVFAEMEDKLAECSEFEEKYNAANETVTSMQTELTELRQYKADAEAETAKGERDAVFAKFEDLKGIEAFEALKENCAEYDTKALEKECFAIRGMNMSTLNFSLEKPKTPKQAVVPPKDNTDEPYGGIVAEFLKNKTN